MAGIPTANSGTVRMCIKSTIRPRASPGCVVDEYGMRSPIESSKAPAPRSKRHAQADAEPEADRAPHKESRTRGGKHDQRIIGRHHHKGRIYWIDRDVG